MPYGEFHPDGDRLHRATQDIRHVLTDQKEFLKDNQIRNEHLIRITLAILGAALALVIALMNGEARAKTNSILLISILPGSILDIFALRSFLMSSFAHRPGILIGIDPEETLQMARTDGHTTRIHHLMRLVEIHRVNQNTLNEAVGRQQRGIRLMFAALILQSLGIGYILWSLIS